MRIILADDHPIVLVGARAIIEASGVGVVVAECRSAGDLMGALASMPCDVLVTDFSMPDETHVDGLAMIRTIIQTYPGLPILLLSSTKNVSVLRMAIAAGVMGAIDKASSLKELPSAIQAVGQRRKFLSRTHADRVAEVGTVQREKLITAKLSEREAEVLRLLASGLTVSQIADQVSREVSTISRQKRAAMRKLGIKADVELYEFLRNSGLL